MQKTNQEKDDLLIEYKTLNYSNLKLIVCGKSNKNQFNTIRKRQNNNSYV